MVFGFVLGLILLGGRHGLLNDPGTPWHLRLGREIIASGTRAALRHADLHARAAHPGSISRGHSTSCSRVLVDHWGWSAAIALAALGPGVALPRHGARPDPGRNLARSSRRSSRFSPSASARSISCSARISSRSRSCIWPCGPARRSTCAGDGPCSRWRFTRCSRQPAWRLRGAARDRGHRGAGARPFGRVGRRAETEHGQDSGWRSWRAAWRPSPIPMESGSTVTWRACSSRAE